MAFITSSGRCLVLASILGRGGEGTIYNVEGDNALAVKIYTDGNQLGRLPKLRVMIADRLHQRSSFAAFPVETVTANGNFAGFTMRKVASSRPLFQLCLTSDRRLEFPDANFRFMVRVALNLAKAVASLNSLGAVIGDLNESGALVNQTQGLVTLVDSDSIQYSSGGQVYRCIKGKAEYTPPELQGRPFNAVDRTVNHDAFGLAVLLFEILFLGRHPFSGIPRASNHPTIAEAIQSGRFAYSPHKTRTLMDPPQHMPLLTDIPEDVAIAFQRAFGPYPGNAATIRPTPAEWVPLLADMEKNIIECKVNRAHYFSRTAPACPWCRFEAGYGVLLFISPQHISRSTFNLDYVLSRINGISSPGPAPDLVSILQPPGSLEPSQEAKSQKAKRVARKLGGVAAAGLALFLMFNGMGWGFFLLIPAGVLFFGGESGQSDILQRKSQAERQWQEALRDWERQAGPGAFEEKRSELGRTATSYRDLPRVEREMLASLEHKKRELQLRKHLESHEIARANIDNIGDGRKLTLRSFGIETAWDVKRQAVLEVPGFGPVLTSKLTDWRRSVEQLFRFNPNIPTDPGEIAKVKAEKAIRQNAMETELLNGVRALETLRAEALTRRRSASQYQRAYAAFRQAEVDWKFLH
jgi:DNA-binding helix-hairpin-helix protein with protein kinase domain